MGNLMDLMDGPAIIPTTATAAAAPSYAAAGLDDLISGLGLQQPTVAPAATPSYSPSSQSDPFSSMFTASPAQSTQAVPQLPILPILVSTPGGVSVSGMLVRQAGQVGPDSTSGSAGGEHKMLTSAVFSVWPKEKLNKKASQKSRESKEKCGKSRNNPRSADYPIGYVKHNWKQWKIFREINCEIRRKRTGKIPAA